MKQVGLIAIMFFIAILSCASVTTLKGTKYHIILESVEGPYEEPLFSTETIDLDNGSDSIQKRVFQDRFYRFEYFDSAGFRILDIISVDEDNEPLKRPYDWVFDWTIVDEFLDEYSCQPDIWSEFLIVGPGKMPSFRTPGKSINADDIRVGVMARGWQLHSSPSGFWKIPVDTIGAPRMGKRIMGDIDPNNTMRESMGNSIKLTIPMNDHEVYKLRLSITNAEQTR